MTNAQICPQALRDLIRTWKRENIYVAPQNNVNEQNHKDIWIFSGKGTLGLLEKTERFWISFFNDVKLVFMLIFSVKSNNKKLFHKSNGEMANVLFAYNGQSYSMWVFWLSDIWLE